LTLPPTRCNQHIRRENQMVDLHIHPYHNDMIEAPVTLLRQHIYEGDSNKKEKELMFHYASTKKIKKVS
jgi:hypothetical protein